MAEDKENTTTTEQKPEETPAPAVTEPAAAEPAAADAKPAAEDNANGAPPTENGDTEAKTEETKSEETKTEETKTEETKTEAAAAEAEKPKEEEKPKMTGRVMIVTGASSGLGFATANYLCEGGNDVILACRNEEKANRAIERIKQKNPNALAQYLNLDLASMESVRKFVHDFRALEKPLHVLVNNAGLAQNPKDPKRQYTADKFEMTIGTNHFGPFLLTNLLLDDLKKSSEGEGGDARIINVSSYVHDPESMKRKNNLQPMDIDNILLFNEGTYSGMQAYKNSKAANIMFTYELARRLEGTNVTVNAVCPGFVPSTDLMRNASGMQKFLTRYILHGVLRFTKMTRTVPQGSQAIIGLATDEKYKGVTGKYVKDGNADSVSSEETLDEEKQKKLWEVSAGYVRLDGYEVIEVPEPPKEEEPKPKVEDKKEEEGEKKDGEEAGEEAKAEDKKEEGEEKKDEEKKDEEEKKEEKVDEKKEEEVKEEKKEEESEKAETEEKKE